jgi:hypothetical protein
MVGTISDIENGEDALVGHALAPHEERPREARVQRLRPFRSTDFRDLATGRPARRFPVLFSQVEGGGAGRT